MCESIKGTLHQGRYTVKHMKCWSTSLIIGEMQIKSTAWSYPTLTRVAEISKTDNTALMRMWSNFHIHLLPRECKIAHTENRTTNIVNTIFDSQNCYIE